MSVLGLTWLGSSSGLNMSVFSARRLSLISVWRFPLPLHNSLILWTRTLPLSSSSSLTSTVLRVSRRRRSVLLQLQLSLLRARPLYGFTRHFDSGRPNFIKRKPRNLSLSNMAWTILLPWLRPRRLLSLSLLMMLIPLSLLFSCLPFAARWVFLMSLSRARLVLVLWSIRRQPLLWPSKTSRAKTNVILPLLSVQLRPICTLSQSPIISCRLVWSHS